MSGKSQQGGGTKLVKPRTKAGKRALEKRAPKIVEDPRRALFLYGNKTSQLIKDVFTDLQKLKGTESLKFTRKNHEARPFESGGEVQLEILCSRSNCSLFALGTHSKKRPNNLTLGRMYDFRLYDAIEFGVEAFRPIRQFSAGTAAQLGNKPAFVFYGEAFDSDPAMRHVRSLFLDYFRGRQVEGLNLKGLDRIVFVTHEPPPPGASTLARVLFRQYAIRMKKSGTRIPRIELAEMGPSMDLAVRRRRSPAVDLEKEACKQPKVEPKKQKNVTTEALDGKVGRIYMPKQDVDSMALRKMKGLKRERKAAKGEGRKRARTGVGSGDDDGDDGSE